MGQRGRLPDWLALQKYQGRSAACLMPTWTAHSNISGFSAIFSSPCHFGDALTQRILSYGTNGSSFGSTPSARSRHGYREGGTSSRGFRAALRRGSAWHASGSLAALATPLGPASESLRVTNLRQSDGAHALAFQPAFLSSPPARNHLDFVCHLR